MKKIFLSILVLSLPILTFAEDSAVLDLSRFESKTEIKVSGIITPKVVRYQTSEGSGQKTILLNEKGESITHRWITKYEKIKNQKISVKEVSSKLEGNKNNLVDGDLDTSFTFHPTQEGDKTIELTFPEKIEVSEIDVVLDNGIIPYRKISIFADFGDGKFLPILNEIDFRWHLKFPTIKVKGLQIKMKTPHFLRISEIRIIGQEESQQKNELIFFAEEGKSYFLYSDAHFGAKDFYPKKSQPLSFDELTPVFDFESSGKNPDFNPDFDGDGINDVLDLCPKVVDPDNKDVDGNGRGDVCEDPDLDNIYSNKDNCPFVYNPNQKDSDQDKIGDECDDVEGRLTENMDFLLWVVFGLGALILVWLVVRAEKMK
jgi:hypothetical protein